jgi:3-deoxy-D-manno-octulosonic-acid transferase
MQQLVSVGIKPVMRSALKDHAPVSSDSACLLVDSTGELMAFYFEADVVFIGKSLCARGGQNPIEPAALGKATVMGPHMHNFLGVTKQLLENDAAVQVADEAALESALRHLLRSQDRRQALGRNALAVVQRNTGATARTVDLVVSQFASPGDRRP